MVVAIIKNVYFQKDYDPALSHVLYSLQPKLDLITTLRLENLVDNRRRVLLRRRLATEVTRDRLALRDRLCNTACQIQFKVQIRARSQDSPRESPTRSSRRALAEACSPSP